MINTVNSSAEGFLASLNRINDAFERAQRQVASGLKLERPSDAPASIPDLMILTSHLEHATAVETNLGRVKAEVDAGEQALGRAVQLLDRALVAGEQALSPFSGEFERRLLAGEVLALQEAVVGVSATRVAGRYIFGGDNGTEAPYAVRPDVPGGVEQVAGATSTCMVQDAAGDRFVVARHAAAVFDARDPDGTPAPQNVFFALNRLRLALVANDASAVRTAVGLLQPAVTHLNAELAAYGAAQNRVNTAIEVARKFQLGTRTEINAIRDADLPAAASAMAQAATQQQAALASRAVIRRSTLFDYLGQ